MGKAVKSFTSIQIASSAQVCTSPLIMEAKKSGLLPEEQYELAEKFKSEANAAFQAKRYVQAVDGYTKAIETDPGNAVYYANRAFAQLRLENYGAAIDDATTAIRLDPTYIKGYYRRGSAYVGLGNFTEGLKDFKRVSKIAPRDPDAKHKLNLCEKAVKKIRFEEAIRCAEETPVIESIDLSTMLVEDSFTGARMDGNNELGYTITHEFVLKMIEDFRAQKLLHKRFAFELVLGVKALLESLPTIVEVTIPDGSHITVCGDVHGQFYDLCHIFELGGYPSEENPFLFNGDFVDRGSFSTEVIFTLFAFKLLSPNSVHLTRGNHETKSMNKLYGFDGEVRHKYNDILAETFRETFCWLPLGIVMNQKVLVVHGGLFSRDGVKLEELNRIDRNREPPEEGLMCDILWSDPQKQDGRSPSKRGVGVAFGPDVTHRFLRDNNLQMLVRSHEVRDEGYEIEHNGQLVTIFSAPNYCDQMGNKGAYIRFDSNMVPRFVQFSAVVHPDVKPMAYASMLPMGLFS